MNATPNATNQKANLAVPVPKNSNGTKILASSSSGVRKAVSPNIGIGGGARK